jgi:hypothetical protein
MELDENIDFKSKVLTKEDYFFLPYRKDLSLSKGLHLANPEHKYN